MPFMYLEDNNFCKVFSMIGARFLLLTFIQRLTLLTGIFEKAENTPKFLFAEEYVLDIGPVDAFSRENFKLSIQFMVRFVICRLSFEMVREIVFKT